MSQEYRVRWEIDIEADTPEEAARIARDYQRGDCTCVSNGYVLDSSGAVYGDCEVCWEEYGFGIPVLLEDGRPFAHLSCDLEAREREKARQRSA